MKFYTPEEGKYMYTNSRLVMTFDEHMNNYIRTHAVRHWDFYKLSSLIKFN